MATIFNTLTDPSGNPLARAYVEARVAVEDTTHVYRPAQEVSLASRSRAYTDANGRWELDLTANSEITPDNTVYEILEVPQAGSFRISYIVVPTGSGVHWLEDLLVDPPDALPPSGIGDHLTDSSAAHTASAIGFTPAGSIAATNVQAAILEAAAEGGGGGLLPPDWEAMLLIPERDEEGNVTGAWVPGYLTDFVSQYLSLAMLGDVQDAPADGNVLVWDEDGVNDNPPLLGPGMWALRPLTASQVVFVPGSLSATNVQAAIEEVAATVPPPPVAADVPFTPAGSIVATDVQAAIEEVATESALPSGTAFDVLYYDGSDWLSISVPSLFAAAGLSLTNAGFIDVNLSPSDGQVIYWDATAGLWQSKIARAVANPPVIGASDFDFGPGPTPYDDLVYLADTSAQSVQVTLPDPHSGLRVTVKKSDAAANDVTIVAQGGTATIDGAASVVLPEQYDYVSLVADGVNWWSVGDSATDAVVAADVAFTPAGTIAATTVQAAIEEVAAEAGGSGSFFQVDTYDTAGSFTWNKPASATTVEMIVVSGGAGGGSGRRGAAGTNRWGGGGGGGGGVNIMKFVASTLAASYNVTVGAGGAGGAARTSDDTDGANGANGASSYVGATSSNNLLISGVSPSAGAGGSATAAAAGSGGSPAIFPGGGGAAGSSSIAGSANTGTSVLCGGGGGGAGVPSSNSYGISWGGAGAGPVTRSGLGGGTGGTSAAGGNGSNQGRYASGGGGGGGAVSDANNGNPGGNGANPGGGGGGGAASVNGRNSGKGGDGGTGAVVIISYG